jgi:hypothetical protein
MLLKHIATYRCLDVDEAPETPGLYAWYGLLGAGPLDWELRIEHGEDAGEVTCRHLLHSHTTRFVPPRLEIEARSPFDIRLRGYLQDALADKLQAKFDDDEAKEDLLSSILTKPTHRKWLLQALNAATPILSSPIYIGVAANLRTRLLQHAEAFYKLADARVHGLSDEHRYQLLKNKNFAARAIGMGFTPDTLSVWTLELSSLCDDSTDAEILRKIAEAAEWFLNRWHRPLAGRR